MILTHDDITMEMSDLYIGDFAVDYNAKKSRAGTYEDVDGVSHEPIIGYQPIVRLTYSAISDKMYRQLKAFFAYATIDVAFGDGDAELDGTYELAQSPAAKCVYREAGRAVLWDVTLSLMRTEIIAVTDSDGL
jgi:hypothetical protein